MPIEVLDPTHGDRPLEFAASDRPASLEGLTIGLLSNGKQNTIPFFDEFESVLRSSYGVADVVRVTKSNYSAPADATIMDDAQKWHALVAGIGD